MRDASTLASSAFRAWYNMLRSPAFLDRDVLLAAGVIADDQDWRRWTANGWLPFIIKATDAQAVALFDLAQERLKPEQRAAIAPDLDDYGPDRCGVCGWPLAENREIGCVAGDCSYRPEDGSPEDRRISARRAALGLAGRATS